MHVVVPVRYSFKVLNATTTQDGFADMVGAVGAPHFAQQVIPCIDQEADQEFEDLSVLTGNGSPGDWQRQKRRRSRRRRRRSLPSLCLLQRIGCRHN